MMIVSGETLTEGLLRIRLHKHKDHCRAMGSSIDIHELIATNYHESVEPFMNASQFASFLELLSSMMRIDEVYILAHMVWRETGFFEMTNGLASLAIDCCS